MTDALARIAARRSCRTFGVEPLAPALRAEIEALAAEQRGGPFGARLRFRILAAGDLRLGTWGLVRGAPLYLAGALVPGPMDLEDFGWAMEELVLELTGRGLGTCWMAGTFSRPDFSRAIDLEDGETIPAITPVGIPAPAPSVPDWLLHAVAGSRGRRPWRVLFYRSAGPALAPLTPVEAGAWRPCLEAVRQAPSARNGQPWRIVRGERGDVFRFLLAGPAGGRSMRRLDAGIAMCHFALAAAELGLAGRWVPEDPQSRDDGGFWAVARWQVG